MTKEEKCKWEYRRTLRTEKEAKEAVEQLNIAMPKHLYRYRFSTHSGGFIIERRGVK